MPHCGNKNFTKPPWCGNGGYGYILYPPFFVKFWMGTHPRRAGGGPTLRRGEPLCSPDTNEQMKNLDFIFVGTAKDKNLCTLETAYHEKIKKYVSSHLILLKDSIEKNISVKKLKETDAITKQIKNSDILILCDERGKSLDSEIFSKKIATWQIQGQRVVFVVGGAFGMTEDISHRAQFTLKLSDFTFPHELARVILLEQVYRALTIQAGQKYHHGN